MSTMIKLQQQVNSREDLEDKIKIGDIVEIGLSTNKKLMFYGGMIYGIYHSFLRMGEDKKSIMCWMSEIHHLRYQNGTIIFDNLNRIIDIFSYGTKEYEAKRKILE
ncbi:MAG: hypothetical protein Q8N63_06055 [Nanoarchaeota archaeon]|nr:hypothetical protein [Nanoarchaeota archaeon]